MLVLSFLGKEQEKIPNLDIQPSRRVGPDWAGLGWAGLEGARGRRRVYMKKTALISLFAFGGWVLIPGAESLIPVRERPLRLPGSCVPCTDGAMELRTSKDELTLAQTPEMYCCWPHM